MKWTWALGAALLAWTNAAVAQNSATQPGVSTSPAASSVQNPPSSFAATPVQTPPSDGVRLPADTMVRIALVDDVNSKDRTRGDKFAIRLAKPIIVDGKMVAPAGAVGMGEVVYAERGGGGGSPGKLVLAARYIDVAGVRLRLKAFQLAAGGESDFREMQVAAEFIGPAVMFINGHNVEYPSDTRATAKIAEDVVLPVLSLAEAPTSTAPQQQSAGSPGAAVPATTVAPSVSANPNAPAPPAPTQSPKLPQEIARDRSLPPPGYFDPRHLLAVRVVGARGLVRQCLGKRESTGAALVAAGGEGPGGLLP